MRLYISILLIFIFAFFSQENKKSTTIFLAGDSTMADYSDDYDEGKDYYKTRYPVTGWGQVFQEFFDQNKLNEFSFLITGDSVIVDDRARGGRSTRTFFEEGRWRSIYNDLSPGDLVIIQFGHNDAAQNKPERYVTIEGYKEYLRLFVHQTREKGGVPIILTPVCRNYPWVDSHLENIHGEYPSAAKAVATEMETYFIDLNQLSINHFSEKGKEYVTQNYFMNLPPGKFEAYPEGQKDNTHFQPEGAKAVAKLVYHAMKSMKKLN